MIVIQVSQVSPTRPERAEALSPGHRPGCLWTQTCRPVRAKAPSPGQHPGHSWTQACRPERAKASKNEAIYKAFALTGRFADCYYTQGVALG